MPATIAKLDDEDDEDDEDLDDVYEDSIILFYFLEKKPKLFFGKSRREGEQDKSYTHIHTHTHRQTHTHTHTHTNKHQILSQT